MIMHAHLFYAFLSLASLCCCEPATWLHGAQSSFDAFGGGCAHVCMHTVYMSTHTNTCMLGTGGLSVKMHYDPLCLQRWV